MPFPSASCHFLLSKPFLNSLNLFSSLYVRKQVSNPYKTTGKTDFHIFYRYVITYRKEIQMIQQQIATETPQI
jgi:3-methyladenine DNA glycosylase AlkC